MAKPVPSNDSYAAPPKTPLLVGVAVDFNQQGSAAAVSAAGLAPDEIGVPFVGQGTQGSVAPAGLSAALNNGQIFFGISADVSVQGNAGEVGQDPVEADWQFRTSGRGVVWYHDFRSDAEVNAYRWTSGYIGGNDPEAKGIDATRLRRNTSDGVTGGGCLEYVYPAGASPNSSSWWRPFAPMDAGNGKAVNDPAANGSLTIREWAPTDGGSQLSNFNFGWYGHPDADDENFDGHDFFLQVRVKMDPRRITGGNDTHGVGKFVWITTAEGAHSLSNSEHVIWSYGTNGNQGDENYVRVYVLNVDGIGAFDPLDQEEAGSRIQPGSEVAEDWYYSGGWDTLMIHLRPGLEGEATGGDCTRLRIYAAHESDANFTKIWDQEYALGSFQERNGLQALIFGGYNNGNDFPQEFYHRYDQVIFSQDWIPVPGAQESALGQAALGLAAGEHVDITANTLQHQHDVQWQLRTIFYDAYRRELQYMGKPASSQEENYSHYLYDEVADSWSTSGTALFPGNGHVWGSTFDPTKGDYWFHRYNDNFLRHYDRAAAAWSTTSSTGATTSGQDLNDGGLTAPIPGFHPNLFGQGDPGIYVQGAFRAFAYRIADGLWYLLMSTSFPSSHALRDRNNGQMIYVPAIDALVFWGATNRPNGSNAGIVHAGAGASSDALAAGLIEVGGEPPILITGAGGVPPNQTNHGHIVPHPDDPNRLLCIEEQGTARVWDSTDYGATWSDPKEYTHPFDDMETANEGEFTLGEVAPYGVIVAITSNSAGGATRLWRPGD